MNTSFPSLRIEGGLLSGEIIDKIAEASSDIPGQKPVDFGLESNRPLIDEIASAWNDARSYWALFQKSLERLKPDDPGTTFTRDRWMVPFFSLLGYNLQPQRKAAGIEGASYFISHRGGMHEQAPPIHITGFRQSLDRRAESGVPRLAPHSLVQEYLNRSEELWGIVTNGFTLRLLRDTHLIRRQAYIEFDLKEIMEGDRFADFALLYRLIHATRLPKGIEDADKCLLEQYHRTTVEQGGRVRDHLRDGVQRALIRFGNGFLHHPKNAVFRADVSQKTVEPFEYYQQLLRIIYRFLFLMVSEERGLISDNELYRQHYSITRIRNLAGTAAAYNEFEDLWASLRVTFSLFTDESIGGLLKVPPLNGDLFDPTRTETLNPLSLSNRDLLHAMWDLSMYREKDKAPWRRINYAALDVEELGSVYESLLEFQPVFSEMDGKPTFNLLTGTERKSTGSYYTPPELVNELIQSALVPVIQDRLKEAKTPAEKEQQLLSLTICDPACGSGHFLLAAARRIGRELGIARTGDEEPSPEQMRLAIRDVITHCIYGVDKNPLAVDLCKVALWLEGHTTSKPLTFLDHRIRCGDSLVGVFDLSVLQEGIPDDAFTAVTGDDKAVAREIKKQNKKEREHRQLGEFDVTMGVLTSSRQQVNAIADDRPEDIRRKRELFSAFQQEGTAWCKDKTACDLWTAAFFVGLTKENEQKRIIPTTNTVREYLAGGVPVDNPQVKIARRLTSDFRFFHWPLEFPEVFGKGGFDCVLGNPPWEKEKLLENELLINYGICSEIITTASHRKKIIEKKSVIGEKSIIHEFSRKIEKIKSFLKTSSRFIYSSVGEVNTYALFTELFVSLQNRNGQCGLITQTGIFTNETYKFFFNFLLNQKKLVKICDFWNIKRIFPTVQPTVKFSLITLKFNNMGGIRVFCHLERIKELEDKWREYFLNLDDIKKVNPNTLTLPMFKSSKDAQLIKKIYENNVILKKDNHDNDWKIEYCRFIDMTNDSHLFIIKEELEKENANLKGNIFIKNSDLFFPIFESKLTQQYNHRHATFDGIPIEERFKPKARTNKPKLKDLQNPNWQPLPRYWMNEKEIFKKMPSSWDFHWFLGFRNAISSSGDARSATFCIIPYSGVGNSMPLLTPKHSIQYILVLLANFNSLIFDYVLKQKVSGGNLNLFILKQLPVISIKKCSHDNLSDISKKVVELSYTAWDLEIFARDIIKEIGPDTWNRWFPYNLLVRGQPQPFIWDEERRAMLKAEIDAHFAKMYGLSRVELEYILEQFSVLQKSEERELGEYRTRRMVLEAWDRMERGNE